VNAARDFTSRAVFICRGPPFEAALFVYKEVTPAMPPQLDDAYEQLITLFLAGRMPGMNHARHIAIARILHRMPAGRQLMHLGLQVTALRAGVPEKYDCAMTDQYWDTVDGPLPALEEFGDVR